MTGPEVNTKMSYPEAMQTIRLCIWAGDLPCVQELLRQYPRLAFFKRSSGQDAFDIAVSRGHWEIARLLLLGSESEANSEGESGNGGYGEDVLLREARVSCH